MASAACRGSLALLDHQGRREPKATPARPGRKGQAAKSDRAARKVTAVPLARGARLALDGLQGREPDWRRQVVQEVHVQIDRIDRELDIQLKRMSQIQQDLDQLRATVRQLTDGEK